MTVPSFFTFFKLCYLVRIAIIRLLVVAAMELSEWESAKSRVGSSSRVSSADEPIRTSETIFLLEAYLETDYVIWK